MENKKITLVIFGGTGDLTKRKLVPAIASLIANNAISPNSVVVGIGRRENSDENYKESILQDAKDNEKNNVRKLNIRYFRGDVSDNLDNLKDFIVNSENGAHDRIFYLATSYTLFPAIVKELAKQGLNKQEKGFTRIVFEKPFGSNLDSSNKIDKVIHSVFKEEQVFRIDHYLAKETVRNISALKFKNKDFDKMLCSEFIESIEFIIDENLGVENRIEYYNHSGAIKDMVQSHMLQLVALLLMNNPKEISAKNIHDEKVKVLKSMSVTPATNHLLGQYYSYSSEADKKGIKNSKTETFARITLECNNKRWSGTDIILRTGKKLEDKKGQIIINFKPANNQGIERILIDIYPRQDVKIIYNHKENKSMEEKFDFIHESKFGPNSFDEYSTLLRYLINGERTLFTRFDELQESWRIVDEIEAMRDKIKFVIYDDFKAP